MISYDESCHLERHGIHLQIPRREFAVTMRDDEQGAGGRVLRVGKKDCPNWFMIAGGAVVMAISAALGRRKILREGEMVKKTVSIASAGISVVTHTDDETGSVPTYGTVMKGTPCWDKSLAASQVELVHKLIQSRATILSKIKDVEKLVHEARKSLETAECLGREKEARARLMQAKSRQCELLHKKVAILKMELEEVKRVAQEKQRLLEAKEEEHFKLASFLQELQHKVEVERRSNKWARSSKLSNQTNTKNKQSSWKRNYDVNHGTPTN